MEGTEDVVIIGAGISGLAISLGLHRKGIRSVILESSESLRASGFALTVWANAWRALDALGVADSLRQTHQCIHRIVNCSATSGSPIAQLPLSQGKLGELEVRCLRRSLLLVALAQELPPDTIRYSSHVVGIEVDGYLKLLHLDNGSSIKTKVLLGCDGVNSVVAQWLGLSKPSFSGRSATRGFAVFPDHGFNHEFSMISGGGIRFGLLPCDENNLYWFFTWTPTDQDREAEHDTGMFRQTLLSKMHKLKFPFKVIEVVEKSEMNEVVSHPLRYRWPFDLLTANICNGNVSVAGDALHPMTPDIGQGGCSALEDAIVLVRCLGEALLPGRSYDTDEEQYASIKKSLEKYAKERRWRSFELIATANFVGFMQRSEGVVMNFLRDKCFSGILVRMLLKIAEFDCGEI